MQKKYVGKPIGARRLTWFPMTESDDGSEDYTVAEKLSRLITITTTPVLAEGSLESDDGIEDENSQIIAYDVTINASQLTDDIRAKIFGHKFDETGGALTSNTDTSNLGALAWEELLSSDKSGEPMYKRTVLYKGRFKEFAETANTKVQGGITYQTHNITGRFFANNNGDIKYTLRDDSPNASKEKAAEWFNTPQMPGAMGSAVSAVTAEPAAGAIAAGTDVKLTTETQGAAIHYTLDGTTPDAASRIYDGPITVNQAMTIKAVAIKANMQASPVFSADYTISE